MSDRWTIALAASAALGALSPTSLPLAVGAGLVGVAVLVRHPGLLCLATAVLVATLASRSLAGLDGVEDLVPVRGEVTLLSDPSPMLNGVRADARLGSRRVELVAAGVAADALGDRLAGERVVVRGDLRPAPEDAPWLVPRHVSGQLTVLLVEGGRPGDLPARVANAVRRTLVDGASPMTATERSLYVGLVIGDDRDQPASLTDDFRGAGLTHLLAVSGQNIAFVIALARPLLSRVRLWPRWLLTLLVVGLFGVMTRFEPSVLRAAAMATVAVTATTVGRPVGRVRVLALTATLLLVVDPLLVRSVGFQLSVAATTAIVVLAPSIQGALPGPMWLRETLAVTVAAQIGVAPILISTFGPMPVAAVVANVLAVPLAGLVMVWGLTAGLVAGVLGDSIAALLHLPTRLLLGLLATVARRSAALPLGQLHLGHVMAIATGLALAVLARRSAPPAEPVAPSRHSWRDLATGWAGLVCRAGAGMAVVALGAAVLAANAAPGLRTELTQGVVRWHAGPADVIVLGGVGGRTSLGDEQVLAVLREDGVEGIDVLVIADQSIRPVVVDAILDRHPAGAVVLGPGVDPLTTSAPVAPAITSPQSIPVGPLVLLVTPTTDRLVVEARRATSELVGGG